MNTKIPINLAELLWQIYLQFEHAVIFQAEAHHITPATTLLEHRHQVATEKTGRSRDYYIRHKVTSLS